MEDMYIYLNVAIIGCSNTVLLIIAMNDLHNYYL